MAAAITSVMYMQKLPPKRCLAYPKNFSSGSCEKAAGRTELKWCSVASSVAAAMLNFVVTTKASAVNVVCIRHLFPVPCQRHVVTTLHMDSNFLKLSQSNLQGTRLSSLEFDVTVSVLDVHHLEPTCYQCDKFDCTRLKFQIVLNRFKCCSCLVIKNFAYNILRGLWQRQSVPLVSLTTTSDVPFLRYSTSKMS